MGKRKRENRLLVSKGLAPMVVHTHGIEEKPHGVRNVTERERLAALGLVKGRPNLKMPGK